MTMIFDTDLKEDRAEVLMGRAQAAFETAIEVLQASCEALKTNPEGGDVDVTKAVRAMNNAFMMAMETQEKAREAGVKRFGEAGAGQLNLDEARAEIGLRLSCLRSAGG